MQTQVLIIGGGATGTGIARDLALRGVESILVEQADINYGASGGNHGLLHSGARYVCSDQEAAEECREEGEIIKRVAANCVENTGGLFVAVAGDDENYIADFPSMCDKCGTPYKTLTAEEARILEPSISENTIAAYEVEDASIDPFKLSLENIAHAVALGSKLLRNARVTGFTREKGRITGAEVLNTKTGKSFTVKAEHVINAAGAWANAVAEMAGAHIDMIYSKGTLLVTQERISSRVINRLRKASDADILVPGGTVSIIGTTSIKTKDLSDIHPTPQEVDDIIREGAAMVPALGSARYIRAYAGVRPLVGNGAAGGGRNISRGFSLLDHEDAGLENFITITGGKLTTYRLMAERTADLVCGRMKVDKPCLTKTEPLPCSSNGKWTEPGYAPKQWFKGDDKDDLLLCECEMVSKSVINNIVDYMKKNKECPSLKAIGLRSRVGKGPCQGGFCSVRICGHLYDTGVYDGEMGYAQIRGFIDERWKGLWPLVRSEELVQAELQEAFQCGFLGMELHNDNK